MPETIPDEQALLQEIFDYPAADVPRLVYADWLEYTGRPGNVARGEFIRVQVRLASLPEDDPRAGELRRREQALWQGHGAAWKQVVPPWLRAGVVFRRGFIDEFSGSARAFYQDDEANFWRVAPAQALGLSAPDPPAVARLLRSPHLTRLTTLGLSDCRLRLEDLRELLRRTRLSRLTTLRLGRTALADVPFAADGAPSLSFRVYHATRGLGDAGAEALATLTGLAHLRHLALPDNHISAAGAAALAACPHLRGLETLDLRGNAIPSGARAALRRRFGKRVRLEGD